MKTTRHICQSVEGALKFWKKAEWKSVSKSSGMTIEQCKNEFWKMHGEGKLVIPIGEECEGFSYKTGCPGHQLSE